MGQQTSFNDICDAALPATSQKWYQISQSVVAGLETIAILFFIYLHRKSKYLHQSIPKSPFNVNGIFYDDYYFDDDDDDIEEEIIIDHIGSNTYSIHNGDKEHDINGNINNDNNMDNNNNNNNNDRHKKESIGYQSPKLLIAHHDNTNNNSMKDDQSPMSKSIDSEKLNQFSLNDTPNDTEDDQQDDDEEDEDEDDDEIERSYYNESQNRYWKLESPNNVDIEINIDNKKMNKKTLSSLDLSLKHKNNNKNKNKYKYQYHEHRETLAMIEANTDNYRIFCVLLPIYYQFLGILCLYCIYRMIYMFLLSINVGNDFGEYSNPFNDDEYIVDQTLTTKQIINLFGFALFQYIESTINHIITFWFLQPSSGLKSLKISLIPASIIGLCDAICTIFAIINVKYRKILLIFHLIMLIFYVFIFFYMINFQKLRWRLFYFYIIFFIVLYVLYSLGDSFVIITNGELDGCMDELAEIMFQFCIPIILALLLFDDSSYWLQLSTELIGDKKQNDHHNNNRSSPTISSIQQQSNKSLQQQKPKKTITSTTTIASNIANTVWTPKLQESVGRFDSKANFNRVIDQLSMTIPVIKKSEIQFIGDTNSSTIGFGSYSAVKKAKYGKNGELVAIKSLYSFNDENYKYVVEFMREAFLSQRLKHQNIVQFKGVLADRPHLCLVYEYMTNGSLFDYLTKDRIKYRNDKEKYYKSISLLTRIRFAIDAAKGIQCLHSHNIIHRDINCRNLLVTKINYEKTNSNNNNNNNEDMENNNNDEMSMTQKIFSTSSAMNLYDSQSIISVKSYKDDNDNKKGKNRSRLIVKVCDFGTCRQISKQHFTPSISYTTFENNERKYNENNEKDINDIEDNDEITIDSTKDISILSHQSSVHKQMTTGIGTVAYMAPEILRFVDFTKKLKRENKRDFIEYDFGIDVYSFGCVLYEIMCSKELYEDLKTSKDVQNFVLNGNREGIPKEVIDILNIPNSYSQLMNQCWSQQPSQRPHFKDIVIRLLDIAKQIKLKRSQRKLLT